MEYNLIKFLGENLKVIAAYGEKPSSNEILQEIVSDDSVKSCKEFQMFCDCVVKLMDEGEIYMETQDIRKYVQYGSHMPLCWVFLWLGRYFVDRRFLGDLAKIVMKAMELMEGDFGHLADEEKRAKLIENVAKELENEDFQYLTKRRGEEDNFRLVKMIRLVGDFVGEAVTA